MLTEGCVPGTLFVFLIEVYLIYNIVLVSGVQPRDNLQECVYMSVHVCMYMSRASVVVAHGLSSYSSRAREDKLSNCGVRAYCPEACRTVPEQALNLCILHWQADSFLLNHQGSSGPQLFK